MLKFQFVNFVAFGKRNSIDLRVVAIQQSGAPIHIHLAEELPQNGSPSSIWHGFNEMANQLFQNLMLEIDSRGFSPVIETLVSLKDECESEAYSEHGVRDTCTEFSMWISFFASLNETEIKVVDSLQE